ncbi:MAG: type I-MYXAN CRISPR-associated protein Cas6/Cmx6 [Acidobacteriota bacterium]
MVYIELKFAVLGNSLPSDHGYALFASISKLIPEAHSAEWLAVETIQGAKRGDGSIQLNPRAKLRMRCPQNRVPLLLKLAGKRLDVDGSVIRLSVPEINLLKPASSLYARCVTIKNHTEPESFLTAVAHKLDESGIKGEPELGNRRVFKVGNHHIIGYTLSIHDLRDEDSLVLQEQGLGGRRRMGCGFFVPISHKKTF